jgi:hypothetical protein
MVQQLLIALSRLVQQLQSPLLLQKLNVLVISLIVLLNLMVVVLQKQHVLLLMLKVLVLQQLMEQFVNGIQMLAEIKIVKILVEQHIQHVKH